MDKNTIAGLLLIFALFLGFSIWTSPSKEDLQKQHEAQLERHTQDSIRMIQETITAYHDSIAQTVVESRENISDNGAATALTAQQSRYSKFTLATAEETPDILVETDKAKYTISGKGGTISKVELPELKTYQKTSLILFDNNMQLGFKFMQTDQTETTTNDLYFAEAQGLTDFKVSGDQTVVVKMRAYPTNDFKTLDTGAYIEWTYTFKGDDYMFDMSVSLHNMNAYLYPNQNYTLAWNGALTNVEKSFDNEHNVTSIYFRKKEAEKVDNLDEIKPDKTDITTPIQWVSMKQQFFTSVLVAKTDFSSGSLTVEEGNQTQHILKHCNTELGFSLSNTEQSSFDMSMYFGPNQFKLLKQYNMELERQVPIGWGFILLHWINRFVVIPVFNWLSGYGISYGIIILILTIILKTVLFPIAYKTYLSSARMRVIKPEVDEINAKFPKKEDAMKKQQAVMQLYKKAGINPMSGCIPMLLQLPILIAMFRFFPSAYELRQQPFLWAEDLSTFDSIASWETHIPLISTFYGNHVSLFCLLMTVATLVYTWMNNKMMAMGGDQQKMMKIMMYMMPIMFLGIFNKFAAALTYYYLLVNLITFAQMFAFRFMVDEKKIRAKIQLQKSKPVVKSKWQLKMEELAKQQQANQHRKR